MATTVPVHTIIFYTITTEQCQSHFHEYSFASLTLMWGKKTYCMRLPLLGARMRAKGERGEGERGHVATATLWDNVLFFYCQDRFLIPKRERKNALVSLGFDTNLLLLFIKHDRAVWKQRQQQGWHSGSTGLELQTISPTNPPPRKSFKRAAIFPLMSGCSQ